MKALLIIAGLFVLYQYGKQASDQSGLQPTMQNSPSSPLATSPPRMSAPSPTWTGGPGRPDDPFNLYAPYNMPENGASWAAQQGIDFANWVDSIQVAGYPHITGVIDVGS